MAILIPIVLAVCAVGCAILAAKLAAARGRSQVGWAAFTVIVGITLYVVEEFVWTRAPGDAAAPAGFDMQTLLPVFAMLGAAFIITQLPSKADEE